MVVLIETYGLNRRVYETGEYLGQLGYKLITQVPRRFLVVRTSLRGMRPGDMLCDQEIKKTEIIRVATL